VELVAWRQEEPKNMPDHTTHTINAKAGDRTDQPGTRNACGPQMASPRLHRKRIPDASHRVDSTCYERLIRASRAGRLMGTSTPFGGSRAVDSSMSPTSDCNKVRDNAFARCRLQRGGVVVEVCANFLCRARRFVYTFGGVTRPAQDSDV